MGNSHKNLLLRNHWANCNQTFVEWSLDAPLQFLFLVMVAILDTGRRWQTQFWKGTTQGSFQQSLVEIGSVVSEGKIFFKFHCPFFLIFIIGQNRQKFSQKVPKFELYKHNISRDFLWTLNFCLFWPIMQIRKKGWWNLKKSSPLKLQSKIFMWISHRVLC
jgi:hypothetical protein